MQENGYRFGEYDTLSECARGVGGLALPRPGDCRRRSRWTGSWCKPSERPRDGEHWSAVLTLERTLEVYEEHGLEIPVGVLVPSGQTCFRTRGSMSRLSMRRRATFGRSAGRESTILRRLSCTTRLSWRRTKPPRRAAEVGGSVGGGRGPALGGRGGRGRAPGG